MHTVLAILIYLNVLSPNGTYQSTTINQAITEHQVEINAIEHDSELTNQILVEHGEEADNIVVIVVPTTGG